MSQTSKERTRLYRARQKTGTRAVIGVPLTNRCGWLLQHLGYLVYPASRQEIGDAVSKLLQVIERLPAETKALLANQFLQD